MLHRSGSTDGKRSVRWSGLVGVVAIFAACSSESEPGPPAEMTPTEPDVCDFSYLEQLETESLVDVGTSAGGSLATLLDDTHFYWATRSGSTTVSRASRAGGAAEEVVTVEAGFYSVQARGDYLYGWSDWVLTEVAKQGGAVRSIGAEVLDLADELFVVDDTTAYYFATQFDCQRSPDYTLYSTALATGNATTLATVQCPSGLAVDADNIYYATGPLYGLGHIERIPKAGGTPVVLTGDIVYTPGNGIFTSLAMGSDYLYFKHSTDPDAIRYEVARVPLAGGEVEVVSRPDCHNMEFLHASADRAVLTGNQGLAAYGTDGALLYFGALPQASEFNCAQDATSVYCYQEADEGGTDSIVHLDF